MMSRMGPDALAQRVPIQESGPHFFTPTWEHEVTYSSQNTGHCESY